MYKPNKLTSRLIERSTNSELTELEKMYSEGTSNNARIRREIDKREKKYSGNKQQ